MARQPPASCSGRRHVLNVVSRTQPLDHLDPPSLALQLSGQFLFGWQVELVPGGEDLRVALGQRVPDHRLALVGAEHDPNRGVLVRGRQLALVVVRVSSIGPPPA